MKTTKQMTSLVVLIFALLFSVEILAGHKGHDRSGWEDRHEHSHKFKKHKRHKHRDHHERHERVRHHDYDHHDRRGHHRKRHHHKKHYVRHYREHDHRMRDRGMNVMLSVGEPGKWFYAFGLNR